MINGKPSSTSTRNKAYLGLMDLEDHQQYRTDIQDQGSKIIDLNGFT